MNDATGWTDCHIHPIATDWQPAPEAVPERLRELGITAPGLVIAHAVANDWDVEDEDVPEAVAEIEDPSLDVIAKLAARDDVVHLTILADPAACGYGELVSALHSPRDPWRPCVLSVGWGPTAIPDPKLERTAARFAWSVAIGGPGLPKKTDTAAKVIPGLDAVAALQASLAQRWATPCAVHLAYGEGW